MPWLAFLVNVAPCPNREQYPGSGHIEVTALPDANHPPSHILERFRHVNVSAARFEHLTAPEIGFTLRELPMRRTAVPKTSLSEHGDLGVVKHEIRTPGDF